MTHTMKKVLITVSGGGFMWQSNSVLQNLRGHCEASIIVPNDTLLVISKLQLAEQLGKENIHHVEPVTTITDKRLITILKRLKTTFKQCREIIRTVDPDYVVCIASSIAIPLFIAAKLKGKKTVFIESITRVHKPSLTGKILDRTRLCNRLYVQWPEVQNQYRNAIYKGTII
mgnify:CR=1 FL=1